MSDKPDINREAVQIAASNLAAMLGRPMIAIVEECGGYVVHQHTADSVLPRSIYSTKREAASRILQLLGIGPVAPQAWPEEALIELIDGGNA